MTNVKVVQLTNQQINKQTGQKQYDPSIANEDIKRKIKKICEMIMPHHYHVLGR